MKPTQALIALGHVISGSIGTAMSTGTLYPLDLVNTRLKVQRQLKHSNDRYDGVIAAFKSILAREGGVGALYNGLGEDVVKSVVDSFLFFGFYSYLHRRRHHEPRILEELAIGAMAGACARALTTPVSNVVAQKQMSSGEQSFWEMLAAIRKQSGILGLWSGYSATLLLTMNPSITFFINRRLAEHIIPALEEEDIPVAWIAFLIAAWSKATATAITYPLQTGKTRLQMASCSKNREIPDKEQAKAAQEAQSWREKIVNFLDKTIVGLILRIIKQEGFRALYAGIRGELLKSFFSHGLTMLTKGLIHRLVIRVWFLFILPHLRQRLEKK